MIPAPSAFLQVLSCHFSLWLNKAALCISTLCFHHFSAGGCLAGWCLSCCVSSAATSRRAHISVVGLPESHRRRCRRGLTGLHEVLLLVFWDPSILVSKLAAPVCMLSAAVRRDLLAHALSGICWLLSVSRSDWREADPQRIFNFNHIHMIVEGVEQFFK